MQHLLAIKLPNFSYICQSKQQLQQFLWNHLKALQFHVFASDVIHNDLRMMCFGVNSQKPL